MKRPRSMKVSDFRTRRREVTDEVARTGDAVVITRRGKPMAKLCPIDAPPRTLYGFMKGRVEILGDIISPIDVVWDAER